MNGGDDVLNVARRGVEARAAGSRILPPYASSAQADRRTPRIDRKRFSRCLQPRDGIRRAYPDLAGDDDAHLAGSPVEVGDIRGARAGHTWPCDASGSGGVVQKPLRHRRNYRRWPIGRVGGCARQASDEGFVRPTARKMVTLALAAWGSSAESGPFTGEVGGAAGTCDGYWTSRAGSCEPGKCS